MAPQPEVPLFKVFMAADAPEKVNATLTSGYITQVSVGSEGGMMRARGRGAVLPLTPSRCRHRGLL